MDPTGFDRAAVLSRHSMTIAAALTTIADADVASALLDHPMPIDELAGRTGTDPRGLRLILDALAVDGLVQAGPSGYRWCDWPDIEQFDELRRGMGELLRTGTVEVTVEEPEVAQATYRKVVERLAGYSAQAASLVAADVGGGWRVLDVAAGAAPFGRAAARAGAEVTILDLPNVVDVGAELARSEGLQLSTIAADVFDQSLDPRLANSFDAVIVGGFLRLFEGPQVEALLVRIARWLTPAGRIFIVDAVDNFEARRRGLALYAVSLATRTRCGGVHSFAHYAQWLERAGFEQLELQTTDTVETSIVSARTKHE